MARPGQKRKRLSGRASVGSGQTSFPSHAVNGSRHGADGADDQDGAEDNEDEDTPQTKAGQALPIADLPEDFTGEPSDGATYLALSIRANASLPFSKRVAVPAHLAGPSGGASVPSRAVDTVAVVETGRHPALPRESWVVLFSAHWRAYRAHVAARWPGEMLPYPPEYPPIPAAGDAPRWLAYINGVPMRAKRPEGAQGDDGEDDMDMDDSDNGEAHGDAVDAAAAEEEAMNAPPAPVDPEEAAMNDAATTYPPREPLVSVLQRMDTNTIVRVLKHLTRFTRTAVDRLREEEEEESDGDPLPPAHARWAFALLAVLDEHLGGDDVSVLREFARVAADVALYRWEKALARGQVTPIPVKEGFYGQGSDQDQDHADKEPVLGEQGGKEPPAPQGYLVGARWKAVRDARARSDATPRPESAEAGHDAAGLDETLARAWTCAHAVVAGWAQWDLVDDFERLFVGVPRA